MKKADVVLVALVAFLLSADWFIAIRQGEKDLDFLFMITGVFVFLVVVLLVGLRKGKRRGV